MPALVQILGLYEDAVSTSQSGDAITSVVLRLSAAPDEAWTAAFHHEWALTSYPRKRNARVGSVRAHDDAELRHGLVLFASPADYVDKHKRHLEDAVARANERVRSHARTRDETVAEAAREIRRINRDHYDGATGGGAIVRLAV